MGEPVEMGLVDPEEILDMTFEVNDGPRWIDTYNQLSWDED